MSSNNNFEQNDDILEFWMKNQHLYPILASIVMDIYSIPTSNTTVERLFSAAGNTITDRRTNLGAEKVNKLIFLKKNLLSLKEDDVEPTVNLQGKRKVDEITASSSSMLNVNGLFAQEKEIHSSTTASTTKKTRIDEKDEFSGDEVVEKDCEDSDGSVEWE